MTSSKKSGENRDAVGGSSIRPASGRRSTNLTPPFPEREKRGRAELYFANPFLLMKSRTAAVSAAVRRVTVATFGLG